MAYCFWNRGLSNPLLKICCACFIWEFALEWPINLLSLALATLTTGAFMTHSIILWVIWRKKSWAQFVTPWMIPLLLSLLFWGQNWNSENQTLIKAKKTFYLFNNKMSQTGILKENTPVWYSRSLYYFALKKWYITSKKSWTKWMF